MKGIAAAALVLASVLACQPHHNQSDPLFNARHSMDEFCSQRHMSGWAYVEHKPNGKSEIIGGCR